jgi:integrase
MLNAAIDEGLLDRIPCKIRVPKIPPRDPPTLTPEECERLFKVAPPYVRPLFAAGLYAGLRIGESIALRVGDVDLERRELKIRPHNAVVAEEPQSPHCAALGEGPRALRAPLRRACAR